MSSIRNARVLLATCGCCLLLVNPAAAATFIWDGGGGDDFWQTAANWVGDVAPSANDDLVFPDGAARLTNVNDFPNNTTFVSIAFSGTGGGYDISGNSIVLTSGITSQATTSENVLDLGIQFNGTLTIESADEAVELSGILSGTGNLVKNGSGSARLSGANTYSGTTTVNAGYLQVSHNTGLGAGDGTAGTGTVVNSGGSLNLDNVTIANERVELIGGGQSGNGVLQTDNAGVLGGPVILSDPLAMNAVDPGTSLTFNGIVSGTGRFGMGNPGTFVLANAGNSFSGGVLYGATGGANSILRLGASNAVPSSAELTIPAAATFHLNGFSNNLAAIAGAGSLVIPAGSLLGVTQVIDTTFSGVISGGGTWSKNGNGVLTLTGSNTFTGTTVINQGTLIVNGSQGGTIILNGGVLGGTGTIGTLGTNGGTVSPGVSPGILSAGSTAMGASTTFSIELDGPVAGTGYDQLNVMGTVTLANPTLDLQVNFSPAPGTVFTIIANDGSDAVSGTFAGLSQGAVFTANGETFTISYTGGSGNDVVLTAGAAVPTAAPMLLLVLLVLLAIAAVRRLARDHRTAGLA